MTETIKLHVGGSIILSNIKYNAIVDRIELEGSGKLSICTLSFYNGDEQSIDEYPKIIFTKTDHPTQYILIPHKLINLSEYAYCTLKVFSGNLHPEDKIILYYTSVKTI